jgi:hypothetical protein
MEDLDANLVKNVDVTTVYNNKINIIVTHMRPGKSDLVKDILRIMKMNVPLGICISPKDDLKSANKEDECMVCYEENKKMYYTSCNRHYICFECSVKLFEKKCPMCRQ